MKRQSAGKGCPMFSSSVCHAPWDLRTMDQSPRRHPDQYYANERHIPRKRTRYPDLPTLRLGTITYMASRRSLERKAARKLDYRGITENRDVELRKMMKRIAKRVKGAR